MVARDCTYFANAIRDEYMLKSHGFETWPDDNELTRYACSLEDGMQALAGACGVRLAKDVRGNWIVVADEEAI